MFCGFDEKKYEFSGKQNFVTTDADVSSKK
jgi:hypothetical protein